MEPHELIDKLIQYRSDREAEQAAQVDIERCGENFEEEAVRRARELGLAGLCGAEDLPVEESRRHLRSLPDVK